MIPAEVKLPRWFAAVLVVVGAAVVCQALPQDWHDSLRYDRAEVATGAIWRLLTANFIHLGWSHLALNATGMVLMSWIFGRDWPAHRWVLAVLIAGFFSSLGVHAASPEVAWMIGLSGALHGLFAFGAVGWVRLDDKLGWALLAGLAIKLTYEQLTGSLAIYEPIVGGPIVTDAHLWGAAGGLIAAATDKLCWRRGPAPL